MKRSTVSKAIVVLLAAILVVLIRGTRRQRRIMRALVGFQLGISVGSIGSWLAGAVGGIPSAIYDFVVNLVQQVADWVASAINWVWAGIDQVRAYAASVLDSAFGAILSTAARIFDTVAGWIASAVSQLVSQIWAVYATVSDWIASAVSQLVAQIWSVLATVSDWIASAVSQLVAQIWSVLATVSDWIASAVSSLLGAIAALASAVWDGIAALTSAVWDAISSVTALIVSTAADVTNRLIALLNDASAVLREFVTSTVTTLSNDVAHGFDQVNSYLFGSVAAVLSVIETVLDWLIALATFPFTTARDMWAAMRTTGGRRILDAMPAAVDRWGSHIAGGMTVYVTQQDRPYQLPPLPTHPGGGTGGGGGTPIPGAGTPDRIAFANAMLDQLGAPHTDTNIRFLTQWMAREGTTASYNPLATTLDYGSNTLFNPVGVRNYSDFQTGVTATVLTLTGSGYPSIVAALRAGDGVAAGQSHADLSRWSGGGYSSIPV